MSTEIVSGGTTTVSAASSTSYIVITPGTLDIASGGTVSGATAIGSGSVIWVEAGGTTTNSSIVGGTQYTIGNSVGTVISSGGIEHVFWGAPPRVRSSRRALTRTSGTAPSTMRR